MKLNRELSQLHWLEDFLFYFHFYFHFYFPFYSLLLLSELSER